MYVCVYIYTRILQSETISALVVFTVDFMEFMMVKKKKIVLKLYVVPVSIMCALTVPLLPCEPADRVEEKEDGTFTGAEELFGTTSESDTSTFHGFEEDELEEPATNSNGISNRHR